jgi:hypothetical protein
MLVVVVEVVLVLVELVVGVVVDMRPMEQMELLLEHHLVLVVVEQDQQHMSPAQQMLQLVLVVVEVDTLHRVQMQHIHFRWEPLVALASLFLNGNVVKIQHT